jgi:hypothetical protein
VTGEKYQCKSQLPVIHPAPLNVLYRGMSTKGLLGFPIYLPTGLSGKEAPVKHFDPRKLDELKFRSCTSNSDPAVVFQKADV